MTDREKSIKGLLEIADWHYGKYEQTNEEDYLNDGDFLTAVANMLKEQDGDALDLVKVVRCKDCMYWKSDMLTHFWKPCDVVSTDKDWYCPCGKRR